MHIKLTDRLDLENVQKLWACPAVMEFVGFPQGLHETMEHLESEWLPWVQSPPARRHYGVYDGGCYCGEAFYDVDSSGFACMDIKLLPEARGRGIACRALSFALDEAFSMGGAVTAWVDPDPKNERALALYRRLGFRETERPPHLTEPGCPCVYMELSREVWESRVFYRDILLRDKREADIADWVRWYNEQVEWQDWDAPDEPVEPVDPDAYRAEEMERLMHQPEGFRSFFELDTYDGHHIGFVTAYAIDGNHEWISWRDAKAAGPIRLTVGMDICDSRFWSRGLGAQALGGYIRYCCFHGFGDIYLQTWSGNLRMLRCAQRLGFRECCRKIGNRAIRGGIYDSLTLRLDLDAFAAYLAKNA